MRNTTKTKIYIFSVIHQAIHVTWTPGETWKRSLLRLIVSSASAHLCICASDCGANEREIVLRAQGVHTGPYSKYTHTGDIGHTGHTQWTRTVEMQICLHHQDTGENCLMDWRDTCNIGENDFYYFLQLTPVTAGFSDLSILQNSFRRKTVKFLS